MKPISAAWFCHIEITNVCFKDCVYCSRFCRHIRQEQHFFMDLNKIETALKSLKGWPNRIGIIGGEPTIHPDFKEVCELLLDYNPPEKYGLWTTGGAGYQRHLGIIRKTFPSFIAYNEHDEEQQKVCKPQPITMACGEVVKDKQYLKYLIDNCWVQLNWCPSIGPKGAFFCEVAYAIDHLLNGPGGYPVKPGWWAKSPEEFKDQVDRYCHKCGMPVPFNRQVLKDDTEIITPKLFNEYQKLKLQRILPGRDVYIFDRKLTNEQMERYRKTWDPLNYRGDIHPDGQCYNYQ